MAFVPGTAKNSGHVYPHDTEGYTRPKWDAAKQDLLSRYPGDNPIIKEHIEKAAKQLLNGQTIGRRGTPVVSFWLMRDKWKNRGASWVVGGTDGDVFEMGGNYISPALLQLVYFKTREGLVCQLAYEIAPEFQGYRTPSMLTPSTIEREYKSANESLDSVSEASDDILKAMKQFI